MTALRACLKKLHKLPRVGEPSARVQGPLPKALFFLLLYNAFEL